MSNAVRGSARYDVMSTRGKPRRRGRKFLIFLVIVAALLVGADFGLAAVAEHAVSQQAREKFELTDDPAVDIRGFPFTTQAISGDYGHITVTAHGVNVKDTLRELELIAELRNVRAPLGDIVDGKTENMKIGDLEGVVKIKQSDVGRLIRLPNLSIEPASERYVRTGDKEDEVSVEDLEEQREAASDYPQTAGIRLAATTRIAGRETEIIAFAIIELDRNSVRINPQRLEFGQDEGTTVVPEPVRQTLMPQFEATISPGSLPFDVRPTGVAVARGALMMQGTAKDITFADTADQG